MTLYIKYMISQRCKMLVKQELAKLGIQYKLLELGLVEIIDDINGYQWDQLKNSLYQSGLELMEDKKMVLVSKIKNTIAESIYESEEFPKINIHDLLIDRFGHDYVYLSKIFYDIQGITIQQFILASKIERVKELLLSDSMSITEISYRLNFSNAGHLSNQFKKFTGYSPSNFKEMKHS